MSYFLRWLFAFLLIAATFNPTQWNYVRWAKINYSEQTSLTILFGLMLLVGYIIYLRATFRSIGPVGIVLVAAVVAALGWVLADMGILRLDNKTMNVWLGILALSVVLAVGLSWSRIRRALSGQVDMDDVDE